MAYFNVAPADQQLPVLRGDERIVLENLVAEQPQLVMTLPGLRPRAKVSGPGGDRVVTLVCDTLWIDTSRGICCLTYRGQLALTSPAEVGWVVVTLDDADESAPVRSVRPAQEVASRPTTSPPPPDESSRPRSTRRDTMTGILTVNSAETERPALTKPRAMTMPFLGQRDNPSGLPFQSTGEAPSAPPSAQQSRAATALPFRPQGSAMAMPAMPGPSPVRRWPLRPRGPRP